MGKPLQTLVAVISLCTSVQANDPLDIRVVGTDWGEVSIQDIKAVLTSAANTLWENAEPEALRPILVMRSKEGPIVLFKRGPRGEYFVKLNTGNRYWCQYAFQIAHEIGHILCRYKDGDSNNKWFEETLCETASLFALRAMAESWKTKPPYQNWKGYASNLNKYAEERIERFGLPDGKHLATFYAEQAPQLSTVATDRSKNAAIAIELLPLFEKNPEGWRALHYINESVWNETQDFTTYLRNWYRHTPEDLKPFVEKVAEKFGIRAKVQENKSSTTVSES
jgi:hypothetical protein